MNSASNIKPLLKPFGCTLCPLSFALAKSLVKHVEVHKKNFVQKEKNSVQREKSSVQRQEKSVQREKKSVLKEKNSVQKGKTSVQREKNSVQREKNSDQREKYSENFVRKEKNSGNFVQKEDSKNVKANLKESNVDRRVNSVDFELGSDFYRPFKDDTNIQRNSQNESKESKSTENLKNNQVYAESDKKSNDSTKSEETKFIVKSEYFEVTSPKSRRQMPVNKFRASGTGGAEGRNRNKTFTLERPSINLGTPNFSDLPPVQKVVHSCKSCSYQSDQMYR